MNPKIVLLKKGRRISLSFEDYIMMPDEHGLAVFKLEDGRTFRALTQFKWLAKTLADFYDGRLDVKEEFSMHVEGGYPYNV